MPTFSTPGAGDEIGAPPDGTQIRAQQVRLHRLGMAAGAAAVTVGMTVLVAMAGFLPYRAVVVYASVVVVVCAAFYGLLRSGLNRRFSDPSLTVPQLIVAGLAVSYVAYQAPGARPAFLAMYVMAFMFGVFGLGLRGLVGVALFFCACYVTVVLTTWWRHPESIDTNRELFRVVGFALMLGWLTALGAYISRLRQSLRDANAQLKEVLAEAELLASHDALTGCYNRRRMMEMLTLEARRAERGLPFSVCLVDLDHFKTVNDTYGHACGDTVLVEFAGAASTRLRPTDFLARYGGEEFLVGLPLTNLPGAMVVAERLRRTVQGHRFSSLPQDHRLTVSIGVAEHRAEDTISATLVRVDAALYEAKDGRNQVVSAR